MIREKASAGSATGVVISARLGYLAGRLVATASATYARLGVGSLEAKVVELIGDGMTSSGADIAKVLGIDPAAISRTLKTLVERGAVVRSAEGGVVIALTPRGEVLCRSIRSVSSERMRRLLQGISPSEQALLESYLERVWANSRDLTQLAAPQPLARRQTA